jgi:Domain of unknown function (DUF1906)
MKVVNVPIGSKGIDTVTVLNSTTCDRLKLTGVDFVVRYLGGVTDDELNVILTSGLGVQLVTYSRAVGWMPDSEMGVSDGQTDVTRLKTLGVPENMVLWLDLEGSGGSSVGTGAWAAARSSVVTQAGYIAGLYVGSGCILSGPELYALANVKRYWRAFNSGIPDIQCGYSQFQLYPPDQMLAGIEVDYDYSTSDYTGRVPTMLVADTV